MPLPKHLPRLIALLSITTFASVTQAQTPVLDNIWNYSPDTGARFSTQSEGFQYGWSKDLKSQSKDFNITVSPDHRYDSGVELKSGDQWDMALRDGWYRVTVVLGSVKPTQAKVDLSLEGEALPIKQAFRKEWPWISYTSDVQVKDGRLTLKAGNQGKYIFLSQIHIGSSLIGRYDQPTKVQLPFAVNNGGKASKGYVADKPWVKNADHGFVIPNMIHTRVQRHRDFDFINTDEDFLFQTTRATDKADIPAIYRIRTDPKAERKVTIGLVNRGVRKPNRLVFEAKINGKIVMPKTEFSKDPGKDKVKVITTVIESKPDGIIEIEINSMGTHYRRVPHLAFIKVEEPGSTKKLIESKTTYPAMGRSLKFNFGKAIEPVSLSENKYLQASKRFADAMLQYGRSSGGEFLREIDMEKKAGKKPGDPNVDQDVYRLMYLMSHVTGDAHYRRASDQGIQYFLLHRSGSGVLLWAEGASAANCENDQLPVIHDDMWRLAPLRMLQAAHDYWENGVGNKETGDFDRHCSSTAVGVPFARHGGAMINIWMEAYKRTHDPEFLAHARLMTNFYSDLMKENKYKYWTGPVEMVMILGTAIQYNNYALLPDEEAKTFMLDFVKRNTQTQLKNKVWSRHNLHAHAVMANRYWQLMDAGETALAQQFRDAYLKILKKHYSNIDQSGIADQSKDVGAVILACIAAYQISGDKEMLALAQKWADHGIQTFMTKTDLPPLIAGGNTYGRISGGSNGGNTPSTLPLGLFLLGMQTARPDHKILLINAPF